MPREVDEWIGKSDNAMPPKSCFLRLFTKQEGRCGKCTRKLRAGNITREHIKPLWDGGDNREANLELWCTAPCATVKTSAEATQRAKRDRMVAKRYGFQSPSAARKPIMPGTKRSKWKKAYNRQTGRFETVWR